LQKELPDLVTVHLLEKCRHFPWYDDLEATTAPMKDFLEKYQDKFEKIAKK